MPNAKSERSSSETRTIVRSNSASALLYIDLYRTRTASARGDRVGRERFKRLVWSLPGRVRPARPSRSAECSHALRWGGPRRAPGALGADVFVRSYSLWPARVVSSAVDNSVVVPKHSPGVNVACTDASSFLRVTCDQRAAFAFCFAKRRF